MARIIEGDVYRAHLQAKRIIEDVAQESSEKMSAAMEQAELIEEDEVAIGLKYAHNQSALDVVRIFEEREQRLLSAEEELLSLSLEIVNKILGDAPRVSQERRGALIQKAISEMARKRRLRIEVPGGARTIIPSLRAIEVEEVCDIADNQVRVVCDAGEIVCEGASVLESLTKNSYEN